MPPVEKISVALPKEMVSTVREAVESGEYASSSEVIREALRDWSYKRTLREHGLDELRRVWKEAMDDRSPTVSPEEVFDRLERKYQSLADSAGDKKECA
ncbi:ribbon-helix-helix domain-containing protein [Occallatibacter savannae]|uniref:ribbon-helix-helix domain-containing protein n=1 Tax=Occallatibacter savannae TaxID=1002691 RepID=UPI000D68E3E0|nr:type II toxin-antitoxin system ParD family antitoxin [Occallatibacter savannae]